MIKSTTVKLKKENKPNNYRNDNQILLLKNQLLMISLRGGGCVTSIGDIEGKFLKHINLPYDFLEHLKSNCQIIIKKADMLMSDQSSLNHVMLALQWFHYNGEYIDICAQRCDYVKQVAELFLNQAKGILRVLPNYIRSQSFIAYRILKIINELLRVVFSFQQNNFQRKMDQSEMDQLLKLIENIKSELEVESAEIWETGVEYELTLVEIMLHNCNIKFGEDGQKYGEFLINCVKSALSLSLNDELINNLKDGGRFLINLVIERVQYPKEVYFTYYQFQTFKWLIIQEIKQGESIQSYIQKIKSFYKSDIERSDNWIVHFGWVQMMCDLLSYRMLIYKNQLNPDIPTQLNYNWNLLIQNNLIKTLPFYKNSGVAQFFTNQKYIDINQQEILLFEKKVYRLQLFCEALMKEQFKDKEDLWSIYTNFTFSKQSSEKNLTQMSLQMIHFEIFEALKDQLYHISKERQIWIDAIQKQFNTYNNLDKETLKILNIKLLQEELETMRLKILNCTAKLIYILIELKEKQTLVAFQIQSMLQLFKHEDNKDNYFIFEFIKNTQEQINILISNMQSDQIQCFHIEFLSYNLKKEKKVDFEQIKFSIIDEVDQIIRLSEEFLNNKQKIILKMTTFMEEKKFNKTSFLQQSNLVELLNELTKQPITKLYAEKVLKQEKAEESLENFVLEAKKMINFLQTIMNLNRIFSVKFLTLLDNLDIVMNHEESQIQSQKIITKILENSKNILLIKTNGEQSENYMLSKVQELQTEIHQNMQMVSSLQQVDNEIEFSHAIEFARDIQNLIFEFHMAPPKDKLKQIQQLQESIIKQLKVNNNSIKIISTKEPEKKVEKIQKEVMEIAQESEKTLNYLIQQTEQVITLLQTELIIRKTSETEKNEKYKTLFSKLTDKIKDQMTQIEPSYQNTLSQLKGFLSNSKINLSDWIFILNGYFQQLDQQNFTMDQSYLDVNEIINQKQEEGLSFQPGDDYKVRECLAVNLLQLQTCVQEQEIKKFVQLQLKELWVKERDERVRSLLRNKDLLEIQKKLFSMDIKSFSSQIQSEMQGKLNQLQNLEKELQQEGNEEIRKNIQNQLNLAYQDIDQYVENLSDMSAQMNISLVFLKEITKELKTIKTKIDALQDNLNQITDDLRILRGKSYLDLLRIRKNKVLDEAKLFDVDSIYIPLKTIEYHSETEKLIQTASGTTTSLLLVEKFQAIDSEDSLIGEINEFLWGKNNQSHDVLLIRGQAGSGKSRSIKKIEEFLWEIEGKKSNWMPIFVSLPSIKDPKFNLFQESLASQFYNFDQTQITQLKEAIRMKSIHVIFILDSYDEMKSDCLQQNLLITNNLVSDFGIVDFGKFIKFIITTRTEILNPTRYRNQFYCSSLKNLKIVELIRFDQDQIDDYLQKYVELSAKRIIKNQYELIKQLDKLKFDAQEFSEIWSLVKDFVIKCNQVDIDLKKEMLFDNQEEENIIVNLLSHKVFKHLKQEQKTILKKDLSQLWNSQKFQQSIKNVNIDQLSNTPFMLEIVVQILPQMSQRGMNSESFKEAFGDILQRIIKKLQKQKLTQYYFKQTSLAEEQNFKSQKQNNEEYKKKAIEIVEILEKQKFFQNYSPIDQFSAQNYGILIRGKFYQVGEYADQVEIALKIKKYTIYEFYDCFIAHYHNQQISKLSKLGKIPNIDSFKKDVDNFSQELALELTINQQISINQRQKGKLKLNAYANKQQYDTWEEKYFSDSVDQEYLKLILSCMLLSQKGTTFSFTHKSIQEFLVAKQIYDEISRIKFSKDQKLIENKEFDLKNSYFNNQQFNISKVHFQGALQILKPQLSSLNRIDKKLIKIVKLSVNDQYIASASNSIFLLSMQKTFLGGQDFQSIHLKNTNLFSISFFGSNFSGSTFENVIIDSCNFNYCNFSHSNWSKILCQEMPYLKGHGKKILVITFSKDERLLASGSDDSMVIVWDLIIFKELTKINHKTDNDEKDVGIMCVNFFQNGKKLVTAGQNKLIKIFDITKLPQFTQLEELQKHDQSIINIVISLDEKTMYSLDQSGLIIVWNMDMIFECNDIIFEIDKNDIIDVVFTSCGECFFALGSTYKNIFYYNLKTQEFKDLLQDLNHQRLVLSQNDYYLAAIDEEGTLAIWDVSAIDLLNQIYVEKFSEPIIDFQFSPDIQYIAILCNSGLFIIDFLKNSKKQIKYSNCDYLIIFQNDDVFTLLGEQMIYHGDEMTNQIINSIIILNEKIEQADRQVESKKDQELFGDNNSSKLIQTKMEELFITMMCSDDSFQNVYQINQDVLEFWFMNSDKLIKNWKARQNSKVFSNLPEQSKKIVFSSKKYLAIGTDSKVQIWNFNQKAPLKAFTDVISFTFSQDEQLFIIFRKSNLQCCQLVNLENSEQNIEVVTEYWNRKSNLEYYVTEFINENTLLFVSQNTVSIYIIRENQLEMINKVFLEPSCLYLDHSKQYICLKANESKKLKFVNLVGNNRESNVLENETDKYTYMTVNDDQSYLILASKYNLYEWDLKKQICLKKNDISGIINQITFSENNQYFFCQNDKIQQCSVNKKDTTQFASCNKKNEIIYTSFDFSKKNDLLAAGNKAQKIILWDTKGKQKIASFSGHSEPISTIRFSFNGQIIASGSEDNLIRLWNINTLQNTNSGQEEYHSSQITCLNFSFDGQLLVSADGDGQINIWSVKTKQCRSALKKHQGFVKVLEFSKDQFLLLSCDTNTIIIWNIKNLNDVAPIFQTEYLYNLKFALFTQNSKILSLHDENLHIWSLYTNKEAITLNDNAVDFKFVKNQQAIAYINNKKSLNFFDISKKTLHQFKECDIFAFSQDGRQMATIDINKFVTIWELQSLIKWKQLRQCVLYGQLPNKYTIQFSNNDQQLNFISQNQIYYYQHQNQNEIKIGKQVSETQLFVMNADKTLIAVVQLEEKKNLSSSILIYSFDDLERPKNIVGLQKEITSISFSFENKQIAVGIKSEIIFIYDYEQGSQIFKPLETDGNIHSTQFVKDQAQILISCSLKNSNQNENMFIITKWNIQDQKSIRINISEENIRNVLISPFGYRLAIITNTKQELHLFDIQSNEYIHQFDNCIQMVDLVSFDPSEKYLAIGFQSGQVKMYNIEEKKSFQSDIFNQNQNIQSIGFSANGESILICCEKQMLFQIFLNQNFSTRQVNNLICNETLTQFCLIKDQQALALKDEKILLEVILQNNTILKKFEAESSNDQNLGLLLLQNGKVLSKEPNKIKIYNIQENKKVDEIDLKPFKTMYLSPDEKLVVLTEGGKFSLKQFDQLKDLQQAEQFEAYENSIISQIVISYNQLYLASINKKLYIKLWNIKDKTIPFVKFTFSKASANILQFSFNSMYFARINNNQIILIEIEKYQQSFKQLKSLKINEKLHLIKNYETKENKESILIVSEKQVIQRELDSNENKELFSFEKTIQVCEISQDSHLLSYILLEKQKARIQLVKNFDKKSQIQSCLLGGGINSLSFSPDGSFLLSGGRDRSIRIWCTDKLIQLAELKNLSDSVTSVRFSFDRFHFAAGIYDGAVGLYFSNIIIPNSEQKQFKLVNHLGKEKQIACVKIFSQQPLLQLQKCEIIDMTKNQEVTALFQQQQQLQIDN